MSLFNIIKNTNKMLKLLIIIYEYMSITNNIKFILYRNIFIIYSIICDQHEYMNNKVIQQY